MEINAHQDRLLGGRFQAALCSHFITADHIYTIAMNLLNKQNWNRVFVILKLVLFIAWPDSGDLSYFLSQAQNSR